jgi:glycosyltransferase involved in cell wall biosynthesis
MKILYVVQRYGDRIVGGSESACRHFAEKLVERGHSVEVLTSCAHNYTDWADEYEPGDVTINGVTVHRLPILETRTDAKFGKLHAWMMRNPRLANRADQIRWARLMGPQLRGQRTWLLRNAHHFDLVVFMTYLYSTTTLGLPTVSGRVPTILQPTAHDEPSAYVDYFNSLFRQPDAFLFFTPEERDIVTRLYRIDPLGSVIGIGLDDPRDPQAGSSVLDRFALTGKLYVVYVGRLDASKGVGELLRFFRAYCERNETELTLVLAGDPVMEIESDEHVIVTGFLDEFEKASLLANSLALVQCSYFESFSIVLCEAWQHSRPALVQGKCEVLRGQAVRSNGALAYEGFAEFEACLNYLVEHPEQANAMGRAGADYVKRHYNWDVVIDNFEQTAQLARESFASRSVSTKPLR